VTTLEKKLKDETQKNGTLTRTHLITKRIVTAILLIVVVLSRQVRTQKGNITYRRSHTLL